jgi:predicted acetyltransferase
MDLSLRPVTEAELSAFLETEHTAFGERMTPEHVEAYCDLIEPDRTLAAFDSDQIVGTAAAYTFELTVPGPVQLPAAGVTAVGVLPTHRRKGVLTRLMARQLDDVHERGEPLAVLTASESGIYGRFGYGPAAFLAMVEIDRVHTRLAHPPTIPGRLLMVDPETAGKLLPACHDAHRRRRVGAVGRPAAWWKMVLRDPEFLRSGSDKRFITVHERAPGEADGYITYRVERRWDQATVLQVEELCAEDDEVRASLWQYAFGVDLVARIKAVCPVDEPIAWRLADPRRLDTVRVSDGLWVRVLDVPAALTGRRYAGTGRLVLELHDAFRPRCAGTYELRVGEDGTDCRPVNAEPDLVLGASELGAVYLGGVRFSTLARAGRVAERTPGALRRADRLFAVDVAPWCDTDF